MRHRERSGLLLGDRLHRRPGGGRAGGQDLYPDRHGRRTRVRAGQRRRRILLGLQRLRRVRRWSTPALQCQSPSTRAASWAARPSPRLVPPPVTRARWIVLERPTAGATTRKANLATAAGTNSSVPVAVDTGGALAGKSLTQISVGILGYTCAPGQRWGCLLLGRPLYSPVGHGHIGRARRQDPYPDQRWPERTCARVDSAAPRTAGAPSPGRRGHIGRAGREDPYPDEPISNQTHTCVLDSTGAAYCWGANTCGELGEGDATDDGIYCPTSSARCPQLRGRKIL